MIQLKLVLTLLLLSGFSQSFAQPGSLDASFAGKGLQTYSFKQNASTDAVRASVADAKGNLYITGDFSTAAGTQPFVSKLLANGKPDPSFGVAGKKTFGTAFDGYTFLPKSIALFKDGSGNIVLAGSLIILGTYTPCIIQLDSTGAVKGMGTKGKDPYVAYSGTNAVTGTGAKFVSVYIMPNGDIMAVGDTGSPGNFLVCRVTSTGVPSNFGAPSFAAVLNPNTAASPDGATSSYLQQDSILYIAGNSGNKIVVSAISCNSGQAYTAFAAGAATEVLTVSGPSNTVSNFCNSIVINAAGNINLGGYATDNNGFSSLMNFQIDAAGGFNFCTTYPISGTVSGKVSSMVMDANNKIILGGYTVDNVSGNKNWTLIRTASDGTLDASFTKIYTHTSGTGVSNINRLSNGSGYLLAGIDDSGGSDDVLIKKITTTGANVTTYAANSEYKFWLADADSYITDIAVRKDEGLLVVGTYYDPASSLPIPVLALLKKDGTLDPSFGGTGGADPGVINISTIAPLFIKPSIAVTALTIQPKDNQILLAGTYQMGSEETDAFIIRLSSTGVLDVSFNNGNGYNVFNEMHSYIHDLALQTINQEARILAYGYRHDSLGLMRFLSDGRLDDGFATNGIYAHPQTQIGNYDLPNRKVELRVQPSDQKIVCAGTSNNNGSDFLIFRLDQTGALDPNFGENNDGIVLCDFGDGSNDMASSVCLKPDGKIIAGGYTQSGYIVYGLVQLTTGGLLDTSFGALKNGKATINKNYYGHNITHLEVENSNAILASGIVQTEDNGTYLSAMRLTATGVLDNTFSGRGHVVLGKGYAKNAAIVGNSFYIAGSNIPPLDPYEGIPQHPISGEIAKLKLGSGPVIRTTTLQLTDLQKTFGDDPFQLKPVSNSTAAVQYSIDHGTCATVNATTGIVTIKCVPSSPDQYIAIKAYQPAIPGFSEASAVVNLTVAKAIPKIIFNTQGGLIDSTIVLHVVSNSTGDVSFELQQNSDNALEDAGSGYINILGEGCGVVQVTIGQSQNYLPGTATANVCGYKGPIRPVAFNDYITVEYKEGVTGTVNVLANDESYTAVLVTSEVDLDPSVSGIQNTFVSPAYGKFVVDTSGNLTYYPFEGFAGTGAIQYTIHDAQGLESLPGYINVTQTIPVHELKATELFTPNRDGLNDAFVIGYVDLKKQNKLKVFDRNGQELLTLVNYRNDWTGDLPNGKQAENGIYYYVFQEGTDENQRELKGVVELKR